MFEYSSKHGTSTRNSLQFASKPSIAIKNNPFLNSNKVTLSLRCCGWIGWGGWRGPNTGLCCRDLTSGHWPPTDHYHC